MKTASKGKVREKEMFGYTPAEYKKFRNYGWRSLILFSFLYCAIYCTRLNLANAAPRMMEDLGFTTGDIGMLTSALFWSYAIGMLIGGRVSEIVGATRFIVISSLATVLVNVIFGFTSNRILMVVLWSLNGLVQSMSWPAGCEIISGWWPGRTRGFAIGYASAFSGFGQAAATLTVALGFLLLPSLGYRAAFFVPAIFPLSFLILYLIFSKSSPEKIGLAAYREVDPVTAKAEAEMEVIVREKGKLYPYKYLLSNASFDHMLIMHVFTGFSRYGLLTWVPMYFIARFDVDIMEGLFASLALPIGMGIGCLVLPTITDHMKKRMALIPISAAVAALCVGGMLFFDPRTTVGLLMIEVLLFVAGFFIYAIAGILNIYALDISGRTFNGTANGLVGFSGYMGAAVQSMFFGFIIHRIGWPMLFVSIAAFCATVAVMSLFDLRKTA